MSGERGEIGIDDAAEVSDAALARPERLAALRRAELLDTEPERAFDRLTAIASTLLGVPVSLVSVVDVDRQFFKSAVGLPEPWASRRETPLSHSFCQHVVARAAPLVVTDARRDPLVAENAAIDDIGVVAYAGFPIESSEGEVLGSLCAIDARPREWSESELGVLRELASLAHTELELRAALREAEAATRAAERASAERAAVIESSSDGIYALDLDGVCTLANAAASTILGYPAEALVGENMHRHIHHSHPDGTPFPDDECPLRVAFREGRAVRMDGTALWRRDGTSFPADCTSSPLVIDGRLAGAVVTFRDVSERVAAAAALRESEMKFRAVFEDAGVGIVITALDGRLLDFNATYERITGRTRDALLTGGFEALTHPDDVAEQRRLAELLLSGEAEQFRMEKRYVRGDRAVVWGRLTATVVTGADGAARFIVGVVEDVTAQRHATRATALLAEAGALLASSLEYEDTLLRVARHALPLLGDACIVDVERPDGTYEALCAHVEPALERALCDLRRERPCAPARADAIPTREVELVDDLEAPAIVARADTDPDTATMRDAGFRSLIRAPLRGHQRTLGFVIFASDRRRYTADDVRLVEALAARATAAIENALLYREAQAATRARDEVLAVVSHDLRNPVHTIGMSASFLADVTPADDETTRTQLAVIRRSAARADRLIRDLLDVTRIEHGRLQLDRHPVGVAELLGEAAHGAGLQAEHRRIALAVAAPDDGVEADVDRHRVLQALENLLGNALKFTPAGGRVALAAGRDAADVWFEVRDSGPGVSPADRANLFRPFWQARRADRRGVGLGLSIVKGIVDAHGGRIVVESDGQSGTTIRFTIPATLPPSPVAGSGAPGDA